MNPNQFRAELRVIISLETKLKGEREKLLRACGWTYTSSFPDCCWRWCKMIDGERFTTGSADEALRMQQFLVEE